MITIGAERLESTCSPLHRYEQPPAQPPVFPAVLRRRESLNQGYHYEHNFGHGERNLSVVFAMLMMLAFLVDQTQQLCCPLFRAVWDKLGSKRALWDNLRSHFRHFRFGSMRQLYEAIFYDLAKELPLPRLEAS